MKMKIKLNLPLLLIFSGFILLFSCKKNNPTDNCNVANPTTDLPWLKSKIETILQLSPEAYKYEAITMATYNEGTVFIESNCDPLANSVFPVYNCKGELLGNMAELGIKNFTNNSLIWKPSNSACNVN
jgi:hypothetical protein